MTKTLLLLLLAATLAASMPQLQKPEWLRRLEEQRARARERREEQEAEARQAQVSEEDFDGGDEVPQHVITRLVQDTPFRLREGIEKFSFESYEVHEQALEVYSKLGFT